MLLCFTPFCVYAVYQFTSLINFHSHFWLNALWLAALYFASSLLLIGISFSIYAFMTYAHFFKNETGTEGVYTINKLVMPSLSHLWCHYQKLHNTVQIKTC